MAFQLCYFDVDETLVDQARRVPPALVATLELCRARGIGLGLATGRMYQAARPYAEQIGASAPLILYNGATIQDPADGRVRAAHSLELVEAQRGLALVKARGLHVNLYLDDSIFIERETEVSRESASKDGVVQRPVGDLQQFLERPPTKLLIIGPGAELEALKTEFDAEPHVAEVVRSEPTYLEILPAGVNKGAALEQVSRLTGVPLAEIAAFGDSNNDIELLRAAGLGVAVANALDAVKAVADHVATRERGEGVAEVLRALVLGESS